MKNTYFDLIDQSYYFPQDGFDLKDRYLSFHSISLIYLIDKYYTHFETLFLPRTEKLGWCEKITSGKSLSETPDYVIESDATIVALFIFAYLLNW